MIYGGAAGGGKTLQNRLEAIYAQIPKIACKGLCSQSCGPIAMDKTEFDRITEKLGKLLAPVGDDLQCKALACGQCMVYEVRPLICRLWGVVPKMRCPFGCVPERWLTDQEADDLLKAANKTKTVYTLPS